MAPSLMVDGTTDAVPLAGRRRTMTKYTLPELPYDYGALEPHISGAIMELHHDKHHRAYVTGANEAVEQMLAAREAGDFVSLPTIQKKLAFNVSGHVLHSLFWQNLVPRGGGRPIGGIGAAIDRDFLDFETFKMQLIQAASTIMGSGWAALVWDPLSRRLGTEQIHDHQSEVTQGSIPLMVIDAWEHAYYLQYRTDKMKYFEALWNLWNWKDIEDRYVLAQKLDVSLTHVAEAGAPRAGRPAPAAHPS
jgi:Fe-Mn family superoxide dismutase